MSRAFVSFAGSPSGASDCALRAAQSLDSLSFQSLPTRGNSKVADFLGQSLMPIGSNSELEKCLIGVHVAHGTPLAFGVPEKHPITNSTLSVAISDIQPGWGETRYFWLLACSVLMHGNDPGRPFSFAGTAGEESVFLKWGRTYNHAGSATSPLAGGLRLICGTSTMLNVEGSTTGPIFALMANPGLGIADAFILGLMQPGQTPICATRASNLDPAHNPLFDQTWNAARHTPGDRVYIQYPEVVREDDPAFASLEGDPESLPLLQVVPDTQWPGALSASPAGLPPIDFLQSREGDLGTIRLSAAHWEGALDSERFFATADRVRLAFAARNQFSSDRLEMIQDRIQTVQMKIDSFPIADLPSEGHKYPMENFRSEVKCTYQLTGHRFRDLVNLGNFYEILDPDFGVLAGWTGRPDQDGPLIQSPILFARACSYVEGDMVPLIGRQAAVNKATEALQASSSGELEGNLDFQHPKVSLGYRLDRSEGGEGWLRPHYVVSFAPGGDANLAPRTVEVAGSL